MTAKRFPFARPWIVPERGPAILRLLWKRSRRIDIVPARKTPAGDTANLVETQWLRTAIGAQVRHARFGPSGVGSGRCEPMTKLPERCRVVVVPLLLLEERIQIHVRIEIDAHKKRRMRARELGDDPRHRLQVATLVVAHLACINIERERARKLRRMLRPGQALQVIVGHDFVAFVPLAIVFVLLQLVVDVPCRNVARGIGPYAAVQRDEHRQLALYRFADRARQRIFGDHALAAAAGRVPIRIEHVIGGCAFGRAQIQDRHTHADAQRAR
jgi:hypothetical protein